MRPWIASTWQRVQQDLSSPRIPHAWCLTGTWGLGLALLTEQLVARLLCADVQEGRACGDCQSCRFLAQGAHPDRLRLTAEGAAGRIRIDAVREAIELAYSTSTLGQGRVIEVSPADALNPESSNALLKVVEEPPSGTRFVFSTALPGALLPTLRSRLRQIAMAPASLEMIQAEGQRLGLTEAQLMRGTWLLDEPFAGIEDPDRYQDADSVMLTLQEIATGLDPQIGANRCKALDPLTVLTVMMRVVEACIQVQVEPQRSVLRLGPIPFAAPFPEPTGLFQLLDRIQAQRLPTARGIAHMALPGYGSLFAVWSHLWTKGRVR
ncbi:MAG: hypothetical protein EBS77_05800 [Gammaproteobacteria bacterium]|nr:hypothetical protein [Gammaproteobacteria bacterium]